MSGLPRGIEVLTGGAALVVGAAALAVGCGQEEINPFDTNSTSVSASGSGLGDTSGGASGDTATSDDASDATGDGDGDGGDGDGCDPQASRACVGSQVYWFDCTGVQGEFIEECTPEEFCLTDACVSPDYNGQWLVTANPDMKTFLCGTATFAPVLYTLTVEGDVATAVTVNFTPQVGLMGTRTGKAVNMTGSFTDVQGGTHTLVENWLFSSPTQFSGTSNETIMVGGFNCGNLVWNVSGVKQ